MDESQARLQKKADLVEELGYYPAEFDFDAAIDEKEADKKSSAKKSDAEEKG